MKKQINDALNRTEIIDRLVAITESVSKNEGNICFSINGSWGSGKSFVIDEYEKRIGKINSEKTNHERYFILHYNCWKYDYYEEPLLSIVSTFFDAIDENYNVLSQSTRRNLKAALKTTGKIVSKTFGAYIESKIDVNVVEVVNECLAEAKEIEKKEKFDIYLSFRKAIEKLQAFIQKITHDYTLIVVVDELDRCLPEYAIKILERLHHLRENVDNMMVIVAIDKKRLSGSIERKVGFPDPEKYLEKFIEFDMILDYGNGNEHYLEKFEPYTMLFVEENEELFSKSVSIDLNDFFSRIFVDMDIRLQEQIVNKAKTIHTMLFSENKKDYTFLCLEVFFLVVLYHCKDTIYFKAPIQSIRDPFSFPGEISLILPKSLNKIFKDSIEKIKYENSQYYFSSSYVFEVFDVILMFWYRIREKENSNKQLIYPSGIISNNDMQDILEFVRIISCIQ